MLGRWYFRGRPDKPRPVGRRPRFKKLQKHLKTQKLCGGKPSECLGHVLDANRTSFGSLRRFARVQLQEVKGVEEGLGLVPAVTQQVEGSSSVTARLAHASCSCAKAPPSGDAITPRRPLSRRPPKPVPNTTGVGGGNLPRAEHGRKDICFSRNRRHFTRLPSKAILHDLPRCALRS